MLECFFEIDSDVISDFLSDLVDIDYDLRSQWYLGFFEVLSDFLFGISFVFRLFYLVDLEWNILEIIMELENL